MLSGTVLGSKILCGGGMMLGNFLPSLTVEPQDLSNKLAIITGSNTGVGLECARKLAGMGCTVVLACRDVEKAERARQDIFSSEDVQPSKLVVERLDLGDAESVREFAKRWADVGGRSIDILINNAGMTSRVFQYALNTAQPYELAYYTNVIAHIQLTLSLLPFLAHDARVINVTSVSQYELQGKLDPNDLSWMKQFEGLKEEGGCALKPGDDIPFMVCKNVYYRTKFMQVVFTKKLQQYLDAHAQHKDKNIGVYVCNPGLIKTQMYTRPDGLFGGGEIPASEKNFIKMVDMLSVPAAQGAMTQTWLATSPDPVLTSPAGRGGFYDRQALRTSNPLLNDEEMTAAMWSVWLDAARAEGVTGV